MPYQMVNGLEFFQRKEIKDVLAYLHLLNNPQRRRGAVAGDQHAAARHRQDDRRPARGIRRAAWAAAAGGRPAGQAGIESIGPRPAALLARFVALFDRLAAAIDGPVEEIWGWC